MYSDDNLILLHIVFYIADANLIVKLGDMGMNRVAADHRDNPLSTCQYTSKDLHASDPMAPKVSSRHPLVSRSFGTMPSPVTEEIA